MDKASNKRLVFCIYLALALSTFGVYWQVHNCDFTNYDDEDYVTKNKNVQAGLTRSSIIWAFTAECVGNWHPLTMLSHILDYQLFGNKAGWHHLTSLLFHIANTLLLFAVLMQMTGALWRSAFVAAAFALHPLHVESVAWISERKDVLSTLFWILTMAAYLRYVRHPAMGRYLLALLLFALGLMAKPMLVTLPFVLLLLDYWPLERFQLGRNTSLQRSIAFKLIWEKTPFFILTAVSSTVTFLIQRSAGAVKKVDMFPLTTRIANAFVSYIEYIGKMIWPSRLAVFYPHPLGSVAVWRAVIAAFLLLAISIFVIRFSLRHKYLPVGWFWYVGTLVPVIGLVQVGDQALADRYTYVPLTGLFIVIAWGLPDLLKKWEHRKIALGTSASVILVILSVCTYFQVSHWRNSMTLFEHALKVTKDNYVAHYYLTWPLSQQGRLDEAIQHFTETLRLQPDAANVHKNMAHVLVQQNNLDDAVKHLNEALRLDPNLAGANSNLGYILARQGKFDEAVAQFNEALRLKSDEVIVHANLGYALAQQGKFDEAITHLTKAIQLEPNSASGYYYLARVLVDTGRIGEAVANLKNALRINPNWADPLNFLALVLSTRRQTEFYDPQEAISLAERACKLTGYNDPAMIDTLAAAYAAAGRFSEAVATAEKALKLAESLQQKEVAEKIRNHLSLYKASQPYIEPPPK